MTIMANGVARQANGIRRLPGVALPGYRSLCAALVTVLCLWLTACQSMLPRATTQPTIPAGNAALIQYISEQPYVTAEAAYRSVYVLWRNALFEGDFAALTEALREEEMIGKTWNLAADQYVDRATIGFMICRACEIRSGLNWQLTGLGRYAWRELQYKQIAGPGSEMNLIGGGEFLGVLARAEDYMRTAGKQQVERAELGAAP
jgi:hypothetical protein